MCKAALIAAVAEAGSQAELARRIGVRPSAVWNWLHRASSKGIPPQHAVDVERATGIPRYEIRPDIFPSEADT
ncbi:MAG: YdaS family helix-turn-helix protein [Phycisphaerae bacterium]|jgi:DNA-binding transcriptional regulator YdaS (Cro superfamily)|nr:YdaS family helix-turn-helix protein [Phycisphaerae bacterium]|tara:strand:- start:375 stop:593 length:219 start_codon:yes stop_codon:yes gene_type:complete